MRQLKICKKILEFGTIPCNYHCHRDVKYLRLIVGDISRLLTRYSKCSSAQLIHHPFEVGAQRHQTEFAAALDESAHQKMIHPRPALDRAEWMLDERPSPSSQPKLAIILSQSQTHCGSGCGRPTGPVTLVRV